MLQSRGFPRDGYPSGWFQVAWSDELVLGAVKPLRYFGRHLVLYRGQSGVAHLFDAFCPHLGAHLGLGGRVDGDDIICPFHGWRWDCQGCNVDIPYSDRTNRSQRLRSWPVLEADGFILMWYDRNRTQPSWTPPEIPERTSGNYFALHNAGTTQVWPKMALHPQWVAENAVDAAHHQHIHRAAQPGRILRYASDGPFFRARQELVFDAGEQPGSESVVTRYLDEDLIGVGLRIARYSGPGDVTQIHSATPVDDEHCDVRVSIFAPRSQGDDEAHPDSETMQRIEAELRQVDNELAIWQHMKHQRHLAQEETSVHQAFRSWCEQFYPPWEIDIGDEQRADDQVTLS